MDKHIIIRDKKMVAYILSAMAFIFLGYIFIGFYLDGIFENEGFTDKISFILLVVSLYGIFLFYFFLKDSIQIVKFHKEHMSFGLLNIMPVKYNEIESIAFNENINIKIRNKTKKIRVFNIEENSEKYKSVLEALANNTGIAFDAGEVLEKIKKYNAVKYETGGPPLRLGSWAMVIFVSLIVTSVSNLLILASAALSLIINPETAPLSILQAIYVTINVLTSIAAIILMVKRMKAAISILKAIYALAFLYSIANAVMSYVSPDFTSRLVIASMILSVFSSLAIMLLLFRYLNISKRVRKTFVYDRFTEITKANKTTDPPFKLFSKEPASLYGVFSWIVLPVFIFILIITIVISSIFANLGAFSPGYDDFEREYSIQYDENSYSSAKDVIKNKFNNKSSGYILQNDCYLFYEIAEPINYEYVFVEDDYGYLKELNYKNFGYDEYESGYIDLNYESPDDEYKYLFAMLSIRRFREKYIMYVNLIHSTENLKIYDTYDSWHKQKAGENAYYFKVLDISEMSDDYRFYVEFAEKIVHELELDEIDREIQ